MSVDQSLLQIVAGLRSQEPSVREDAADQISYLLENALSNQSNIEENVYSQIVTSLLQTALVEPDFSVKESMFSALVDAACFSPVSKALSGKMVSVHFFRCKISVQSPDPTRLVGLRVSDATITTAAYRQA